MNKMTKASTVEKLKDRFKDTPTEYLAYSVIGAIQGVMENDMYAVNMSDSEFRKHVINIMNVYEERRAER